MKIDNCVRFFEIKKFLNENPDEAKVTIARMFYFAESTLRRFIIRDDQKSMQSNAHNDHNKMLKEHQIRIFHRFIRSLLTCSIFFTKFLIFNVIQSLKFQKNSTFQNSFKRWFQTWWKTNDLHIIKTKSLITVRYTAENLQQIEIWFKKYKAVLRKLNIKKKRNIINFDEQKIWINCIKRQKILMFENIVKFYSLNSENKQSIIIFKNINAADEYSVAFMLIIQNHELMKS